jgi:hypothetical protein
MTQIKCPTCDGRGWIDQLDADALDYLRRYPDVANSSFRTNPRAHYDQYGRDEGRTWGTSLDADALDYLRRYPDVAASSYATNPREHYDKYGKAEGRTWGSTPVPPIPQPPGPPASGEIKDFVALHECNNPTSCYFGIQWPLIGTYGMQGDRTSEVYQYPHNLVRQYTAESVIAILDGIHVLERGGDADRGQILYNGNLVYQADDWSLCLMIHKHSDGYYYVTGKDYNDSSAPGGWVRSRDKVHWERWGNAQGADMVLGMCSDGNDLITFGTSNGTDWGGNNCYPVAYRNRQRVAAWTDRTNDGSWAACSFKGRVYGGLTGHSGVVRLGDNKVVLSRPTHNACHDIIVDKQTETMLALFCKDAASGAEVWATSDGDNWRQINGAWSCPGLFWADQAADGTIYLAGGRFSQGGDGYGRIYKSIRG